MKHLKALATLVFLISYQNGLAQINPPADNIYNPDYLAEIRINMLETDKAFMLDEDNKFSEEYHKCTVSFKNEKVDETINDVGIRIRGNTSRSHPKKSFKLKFTEYGGGKFYGFKKFNLKAENNDPSCIREHSSLSVYRAANVPAARTHFAKVFINNEYMGLYTNIEQIDDEFCDLRYGSEAGNLYKCSWGASLTNDNDLYNNSVFELETNKDADDRSILENFIDVLNNTSDANFKTEIEKVLEVENALKFLAVEAILGHWDGYSFNKNNFYILEHPLTNKIVFIPYDADNSFGIEWIPGDWAKRDLTNWANEDDDRPLYTRLLAVPSFYEKYVSILWDLLKGPFSEEELFPMFDDLKTLLADAVKEDDYYSKTFGFSYSDYEGSHTEEVAKHCPYGLKPFVKARTEAAIEQLPIINGIDKTLLKEFYSPSVKVFNLGETIFLDFRTNQGVNGLVTVYNMSGQAIYQKSRNELENPFILNGTLNRGSYFVVQGNNLQRIIIR